MIGVCSVSRPPFHRGLGREIGERLERAHVLRPAIGVAGVVHRVGAEPDVLRAQHLGPGQREREQDGVARGNVGDRYALRRRLAARRCCGPSAPSRRMPRDRLCNDAVARRRRARARRARRRRARRDGAARSPPSGSGTRGPPARAIASTVAESSPPDSRHHGLLHRRDTSARDWERGTAKPSSETRGIHRSH